MKSFEFNYISDTRESIEAFSRDQSLESTILIKDLDSQSFAIEQKPMLSMMSRQINYGVLTQHMQQEYNHKLKNIQHQNKQLKHKIYSLQDEIRNIKDHYDQQLRLKSIAQGQYISGIKSMYQRNTQLNQKIIIYERQLKASLLKTCQLQKQLQQINIKSKKRSNKQHDLESKIKGIEEKYHQKIISLQDCYEKDKIKADQQLRQNRYQILTLKQQIEREKNLRISIEVIFESKNKAIVANEAEITRLKIFQEQNKKLQQQNSLLKQQISKLQIETQIQKKLAQQKIDVFSNNTITKLTVQNIVLKQQQSKSSKNLLTLQNKIKTFENQLKRSVNARQSNFTPHNYHKRQRFSSAHHHQDFSSIHKQMSEYDINIYSNNRRNMNRQSNLIIRSQKRENINAILIRRCKELNQSLYA